MLEFELLAPRPQNRLLIPLRVYFQNYWRAPPSPLPPPPRRAHGSWNYSIKPFHMIVTWRQLHHDSKFPLCFSCPFLVTSSTRRTLPSQLDRIHTPSMFWQYAAPKRYCVSSRPNVALQKNTCNTSGPFRNIRILEKKLRYLSNLGIFSSYFTFARWTWNGR